MCRELSYQLAMHTMVAHYVPVGTLLRCISLSSSCRLYFFMWRRVMFSIVTVVDALHVFVVALKLAVGCLFMLVMKSQIMGDPYTSVLVMLMPMSLFFAELLNILIFVGTHYLNLGIYPQRPCFSQLCMHGHKVENVM